MVKIFLDTNVFIDAIHRHPEQEVLSMLESSTIFISPLSVHIYCYIYKIKVLGSHLHSQMEKFELVDLNSNIYKKAISGPTNDFEDNVQLHSAVEVDCDIFLTHDKDLLKLGYFGKTKISDHV